MAVDVDLTVELLALAVLQTSCLESGPSSDWRIGFVAFAAAFAIELVASLRGDCFHSFGICV